MWTDEFGPEIADALAEGERAESWTISQGDADGVAAAGSLVEALQGEVPDRRQAASGMLFVLAHLPLRDALAVQGRIATLDDEAGREPAWCDEAETLALDLMDDPNAALHPHARIYLARQSVAGALGTIAEEAEALDVDGGMAHAHAI